VVGFLGVGGPIARALGATSAPRPGQLEMARQVARAFANDGLALLEAGTGTGKTFAYLVPAALHALLNREPVVVSTATIHLQEQVAHKDVPLVRRALEGARLRGRALPRLEAAVVKGRSNYVSLRRAAEAGAQDATAFGSDEERDDVARLAAWARTTRTGDKGELSPQPGAEAWEHVESQADNCLGRRCPTHDACHYFTARRAAARAHIIIVNHHLLLSDVAIKETTGFERGAVLPPFRRLVLDEAHHLEQVAGERFGATVSDHALTRALGRLRRKGARRGLLPALLDRLEALGPDGLALARTVDRELLLARDLAGQEVEAGLRMVAHGVRACLPAAERDGRGGTLRLAPHHAGVIAPLVTARPGLAALASRTTAFVEHVETVIDEDRRAPLEGTLRELHAAARRLAQLAAGLGELERLDGTDPVRWAEVERDRRGHDRVTLRAAPLEVGELVRRATFDPTATVVLTSATLAVGGELGYVEGRLGLDVPAAAARLARARIASPFDYPRQALLAVPTDLPVPDAPGHEDAVARALLAAVRASRGRAFALFTSYGALTRAHRALEGPLRAEGLVPLRQGEAGRLALLERFKATPGAVLFGTDSFWEGVDVPGDALVLVVIARLPFRQPSDPLQEARAEAIARAGGDPFHALQLPQAALKLRQGFGRLIRTASDRGAVLVLDQRLVTRSYGRVLRESLPDVRFAVGPLDEVMDELRPYVRPRG
jgi:ATP-dependent DNA helicase DinG